MNVVCRDQEVSIGKEDKYVKECKEQQMKRENCYIENDVSGNKINVINVKN